MRISNEHKFLLYFLSLKQNTILGTICSSKRGAFNVFCFKYERSYNVSNKTSK